jgi:hypothetical protein
VTGIAPRQCLGYPRFKCGNRVVGRSRCASCDAEYERLREARRVATRDVTNPWRWVYRDRRWNPARRACLTRDNYACVDCGYTDTTGANLQADHDPALQDRAEGADPFDVDFLKTRCAGAGTRNCHAKAEGARRRERARRARLA